MEPRGGFVECLSLTPAAQQSVTKIISLTFVNLVTPKAWAKHELLFNKSASVPFQQTHKLLYGFIHFITHSSEG